MKTAYILGIFAAAGLIIWFEWTRLKPKQKKEKNALLVLTAISCLLGILLVFFPDMPGPTQLVDRIYKPLGKMLEK